MVCASVECLSLYKGRVNTVIHMFVLDNLLKILWNPNAGGRTKGRKEGEGGVGGWNMEEGERRRMGD